MEECRSDRAAQLRWTVYWLLIAVSVGGMVGRILAVDSVDKLSQQNQLDARGDGRMIMRPFLSANDRSRWCTIRSLVEFGTYEIDQVLFVPETLPPDESFHVPPGQKADRSRLPAACPTEDGLWDTIDRVRHRNREGRLRFYSSKPPLLATLLAGEYWLIHQITGATFEEYPYHIARFVLITINVLPLVLMFVLLARLVERLGTSDWGRIFVMATATLGTLLTTFAVTLNNHLPAAVSATIALYAAVRIWGDGERRLRYFALAGFFAAFTAANELPALAFFAALAAVLLWKAPRQTATAFLPAALVVAAAFFGTNKIAHDRWSPPYAQRSRTNIEDNWYDYEYYVEGSKGPVRRESYWRASQKEGVDRGEKDSLIYAIHVLVGHHGIFSITPVWLLSLAGIGFLWRRGSAEAYARSNDAAGRQEPSKDATGVDDTPGHRDDAVDFQRTPNDGNSAQLQPRVAGRIGNPSYGRDLALFVAAITGVCLVFYLLRPIEDRNYGGVSAGFRWMFWFAPFWLLTMLPTADRMAGSRGWRIVALVLLGLSVLSASYPTWNPWTHPWIYEYLQGMGLIDAA